VADGTLKKAIDFDLLKQELSTANPPASE
jgi:hypothetical protein